MKAWRYFSRPDPTRLQIRSGPDLDALAGELVSHESLDDAVLHMQREGSASADGSVTFEGIKQLFEKTHSRRCELISEAAPDKDGARHIQHILEALPVMDRSGGTLSKGSPGTKKAAAAIARILRPSDKSAIPHESLMRLAEKVLLTYSVEKQLHRARWGYDLECIDSSDIEAALSSEDRQHWEHIKRLPDNLIEQGFAIKTGAGLKLAPRGLHRTAWNMLREMADPARHTPPPAHRSPPAAEPYLTRGTRAYRFGDTQSIDPARSLMNTLKRTGAQLPVRVREGDFEVYEREPVMRCATVILLDLSKSMRFENRYRAAKKVSLALSGLIRSRFPQDRIDVFGFSTSVTPVPLDELPFLMWDESNPYTNIEEALSAARRRLFRFSGYRRRICLITDGEPTAHRERGSVFFQFPPHQCTLQRSLHAAEQLVQSRISLSIFLLARERDSIGFMKKMARRGRAKLFMADAADLGSCVLYDYCNRQMKRF